MSYAADECVQPYRLIPSDEPVCFIIGAMAHGKVRLSKLMIKKKRCSLL